MNYREFINHVKNNMEVCFGKEKQVEIKRVLKNNDVELDALIIQSRDSGAVPTIYLNDYYEDYVSGRSIEDIEEEIFYIYEGHYEHIKFDIDSFMDFEYVKERIVYKIINKEKNTKFLEDVPYIQFLDLAVVFYYILENSDDNEAITVIHDSLMKIWNKNKEELFEIAKVNTPRLLPFTIQSMEDIINELLESKDNPYCVEENDAPVMYVLTNQRKFLGAATILYPDVLKNFSEKLNMDIFVLPSSVHEVILVPDMGGVEKEGLTKMVKEVNKQELKESEILSDHAYIFSIEECKLMI